VTGPAHPSRWLRAVLPCLLAGAGCGGHGFTARIDQLQSQIDELTLAGAYRCAPRELALATSHLSFARNELLQGDERQAEAHLQQARDNAGAAELLSPRERCAEGSSASAPPVLAGGADDDGDGVSDEADRCPDAPEDADGYLDHDGCPELDNDQDGVGDRVDACPGEPEDRDGLRDEDGCPDRDDDGDGVEEPLDRCPEEPGSPAEQGCPRLKYPGLEVTERDVRLTEPVIFEGNTATIRSVSFTLLDTLVQALNEHPQMTLEVQGHTDSQGDDGTNMGLSQARAEAVLAYLVGRGINSSRLTARGYGETRPIESNRTSQGRAINRRIELIRTDGAR
jgi:outer membrane protein OmpA-like peptidoglycan-associated protein